MNLNLAIIAGKVINGKRLRVLLCFDSVLPYKLVNNASVLPFTLGSGNWLRSNQGKACLCSGWCRAWVLKPGWLQPAHWLKLGIVAGCLWGEMNALSLVRWCTSRAWSSAWTCIGWAKMSKMPNGQDTTQKFMEHLITADSRSKRVEKLNKWIGKSSLSSGKLLECS